MALIDKINEIAEAEKANYGNSVESVPDWLIAQKLNEAGSGTGQKTLSLATAEARKILTISGDWSKIETTVESSNDSNLVLTCQTILDILTLNDTINENEIQKVSQILQTLVVANIITATSKTEIENKTKQNKSYSEQIGEEINARTVGIARGANENHLIK